MGRFKQKNWLNSSENMYPPSVISYLSNKFIPSFVIKKIFDLNISYPALNFFKLELFKKMGKRKIFYYCNICETNKRFTKNMILNHTLFWHPEFQKKYNLTENSDEKKEE